MKISKRLSLQTTLCHNMKNELFDIYNFIKIFLRLFIYTLLFWSLGRYGFSFIWLFVLAFVETIERRYHLLRMERIHFFQELTNDTRPTVEKYLANYPLWLSYPDFDRCEWLNKLIEQMWPIISHYVQNIVKNTIEPEIKKQISGLSFERIDLGDCPPRLGGIKIYADHIRRSDEIILDTELFYGGDIQIQMKYHRFKVGIKSFYLHGQLRVILKSMISKLPFIGALELFFLHIPTIHFDLTDIANIIEIPGLYNLLVLSFERILQTFIVIPNRLILAFINDIDINELKFPKPDGILRIDIIEAKNLPKYNHRSTHKKRSMNIFVMITIGQYKFKTHTQELNNPQWYETFECPIEQSNTQQLQISILNTDLDIDDRIGTLTISINSIRNTNNNCLVDRWYDLIGTNNSTIHIRMNWFYLSNNNDCLQQIKQINHEHRNLMLSKNLYRLSTSLLIVYIERAEQLPSIKNGKTFVEPYSFCVIKIDSYEEKTSIIKNTINPCWMKSFMFMLSNPDQSLLEIHMYDSNNNRQHLIGTVEISIKTLMNEKDWILNRSYELKTNSPRNLLNTKLYIKLQLLIMTKIYPPTNQHNLSNEIYSTDNNIRSKIKLHLTNKQNASPTTKRFKYLQILFSSCIKKH